MADKTVQKMTKAAGASGKNGGGGKNGKNGRTKARATPAANGANMGARDGQLFRHVPPPTRVDYPLLEDEVQRFWDERDMLARYLRKNDGSVRRWSFLDGPITANNAMGVHHAWGRTYKDIFQRFHTMLGERQRYQNGFDCQGLWVEVEVEKELGFNSKRDIEAYGIAPFVEK